MSTCAVRLSLAENVKRFVNIVARYALETDVRDGRYVVDGSSLPGILSLNLSKTLNVVIYGDDCEEMLRDLSPFIVS
ncbi:MAG: HPr family phosphocarrier protein [bacterium]